jgi:ribosomal protein L20A (L18A)
MLSCPTKERAFQATSRAAQEAPLERHRVGIRLIDEPVDGDVQRQRVRSLVAEHMFRTHNHQKQLGPV